MDKTTRCDDERCGYDKCPCIEDGAHSGYTMTSPSLGCRFCCERSYRRGYYEANKATYREHARSWAGRNPDRTKASYTKYQKKTSSQKRVQDWIMRRRFGISGADYEAMVMAQCGLCAVCGLHETRVRNETENRRLAVHHNHDSGVVIALVCSKCNAGMGLLGDEPELMRRAADLNEGR